MADYLSVVSDIMGRRRFGTKPGVEVSKELLKELGYPEREFHIIHIAGTNGKGSVAAFTASILTHAGFRTGLFTSPHLLDFRERIRVDGIWISREDVCRFFSEIDSLGGHPTMFDISFLMAMLYFREKGCDYAVIETGLGGRLDSTNAISQVPDVCAITSIGLDHTDILGETLEDIKREKEGIIKPGAEVVRGEAPVGRPYPLINRSTAKEIIKKLRLGISEADMEAAMDAAVFPGRLQKVWDDPVFIVDGAHNPPAAKVLTETLDILYPSKDFIFITGALKGHDTRGVLDILAPKAHSIYAVGIEDERAYGAEEICDMLSQSGVHCHACESLSSALKSAGKEALKSGCVMVACGSLYLAGEVIKSCADLNSFLHSS